MGNYYFKNQFFHITLKYALTFIGAASATLGPLPGDSTAFPVYTTLDSPVSGDLETNAIKDTYVKDTNSQVTGTTRGYRNNLYILPLQTTTKVVTAGNDSTTAANATGYRSWWIHELGKVGTYIAPNTGANDTDKDTGNDAGGSAKFVICSAIDTSNNCNGRMYNKTNVEDGNDLVKLKERWVKYRT